MKLITTTLLILAFLTSVFTPATAQKTNKKDEQFKEMTTLIENGRYEFSVQSVQPTGANTIHSSSYYTLVANDSIFKADLPYFGRVYMTTYGSEGGIKFEGQAENLKITLNEKKRMIEIQFHIRGKNEKFEVFLSIGSSGFASLRINSQNRQPIAYSGTLGPLEEE